MAGDSGRRADRSHALPPETTIRAAMEIMTEHHLGILPVVNPDHSLFGVVVDGDIRRAIVKGVALDAPVSAIATRGPVAADVDTPANELAKLMVAERKQAVPLIDARGRFVRLAFLEDVLHVEGVENKAVIVAGGFGKRLRPYTDKVPKPMLRIGSKPMIEKIVEGLVEEGVRNIIAILHYKPEVFIEHFRERRYFGKSVEFVIEDEPRGTAGGLSLLRDRLDAPFLVVNGDNLVRADWRDMLDAHGAQGNAITVGAAMYSTVVPYGVLVTEGPLVTGVAEKPTHEWLTVCSAYCVSPEALTYVPDDGPFDMPELISAVLADGGRVRYFHVREHHRLEDLARNHKALWEA